MVGAPFDQLEPVALNSPLGAYSSLTETTHICLSRLLSGCVPQNRLLPVWIRSSSLRTLLMALTFNGDVYRQQGLRNGLCTDSSLGWSSGRR